MQILDRREMAKKTFKSWSDCSHAAGQGKTLDPFIESFAAEADLRGEILAPQPGTSDVREPGWDLCLVRPGPRFTIQQWILLVRISRWATSALKAAYQRTGCQWVPSFFFPYQEMPHYRSIRGRTFEPYGLNRRPKSGTCSWRARHRYRTVRARYFCLNASILRSQLQTEMNFGSEMPMLDTTSLTAVQ
jgi:hypothetical protein